MSKAFLNTPSSISQKMRSPEIVMNLSRMGSSFQTRLSFSRALTRRISSEKWGFELLLFEMDKNGFGNSILAVHTKENTYSLIAFTNEIAPENRTDRVVAEVWDATFSLFDGIPTESDIKRLAKNTPKQEAGRFRSTELVLARANKSLRLFDHVVYRLSNGLQPDINLLKSVGYLMRTTAVYGSGKFGCADREKIINRPETRGSFQVELLTVYLIRWFTILLVEFLAKKRGGQKAVILKPEISKFIGVGNATGLGMAPFMINHPILINNWVLAKETALASVIDIKKHRIEKIKLFKKFLAQARLHISEWKVSDEKQNSKICRTRDELEILSSWLELKENLSGTFLWERILNFAEKKFSMEGQELVVSLLIETYGELVDYLSNNMESSTVLKLDPSMRINSLKELIKKYFDWVLKIDFNDPERQRKFWYYSEEKLEPRFGDRFCEPGAEHEMPLAIGRDVFKLYEKIINLSENTSVSRFLLNNPEFRDIIRRIQSVVKYPYAEIRDNLVDSEMRPIDLLRFKLAFFGASKFDPKSELWTRITLFQGAPLPNQFLNNDLDEWPFPVCPNDLLK